MLSLDNALNEQELRDFDARVRALLKGERYEYVAELKLDGLSMAAHFEGGRFKQAVTRGDGRIDARLLSPEGPLDLSGARRFLNPGSVGQPRDGDPRASFGIVDLDGAEARFELVRVDYPIEETQARMREVGLPEPLAQRLALGK